MKVEKAVEIDAPVDVVWTTVVDVERWPEWSASFIRVERLDGGPLAEGARVRIRQPRVPALVWEVTELIPGSSFTWRSRTPGITTLAAHVLTAAGPHRTVARLEVVQSGPLALAVAALMGRTTRRWIAMEAEGLKRRSEGR